MGKFCDEERKSQIVKYLHIHTLKTKFWNESNIFRVKQRLKKWRRDVASRAGP